MNGDWQILLHELRELVRASGVAFVQMVCLMSVTAVAGVGLGFGFYIGWFIGSCVVALL